MRPESAMMWSVVYRMTIAWAAASRSCLCLWSSWPLPPAAISLRTALLQMLSYHSQKAEPPMEPRVVPGMARNSLLCYVK